MEVCIIDFTGRSLFFAATYDLAIDSFYVMQTICQEIFCIVVLSSCWVQSNAHNNMVFNAISPSVQSVIKDISSLVHSCSFIFRGKLNRKELLLVYLQYLVLRLCSKLHQE